MATWEDGPEYAPVERPDEFAVPSVATLEVAPPVLQPAEGAPRERPLFDGPTAPVPSLADLVPSPTDRRDPAQPFDVASSAVTAGGAWSGVHQTTPAAHLTAPVATPAPVGMGWPAVAPVTGSYPAPGPYPQVTAGPPVPYAQPSTPAGSFPGPGTPAWFGPGPYGDQPPSDRVDARSVLDAATPGLLILLGVGALVYVLSPVLLGVTFVLARRVKVARDRVRRAFAVALGIVGTFAVIALLSDPLGFGEWWAFVGVCSLLVCWAMLITTVALVYRALKAGERPPVPPPAFRGPWG